MTMRLMYSYVFTIPPIQVPNARHLRLQHTFSLVTSHEHTIQQSFEGEFRQHDGMMTVMMKLLAQGFA